MHFLAYAVYAAAIFLTFSARTGIKKTLALSIITAAAVGAATELMQLYVPGRFGSISDWSVDAAGAVIGLVVVFLLNSKTRKMLGK